MGTAGTEFLALLLVLGMIAVVVALVRKTQQRWLETLTQAGTPLGLTIEPGSIFRSPRAEGVVGDVPICLDSYTVSRNKSSTTYTRVVARPLHMPRDLSLKSEGFGASIGKFFKGEDVAVGDAGFDDDVVARGDEGQLRSLLDAETRNRVRVAMDMGLVVEDGEVRWIKTGRVRNPDELRGMAETVLDLARALNPENERTRLLHIVQTDRDEEVVAGALRSFLDRWKLQDTEADTLLAHPALHVRLAVAPYLGARAWPVLAALAGDRRQPQDTRARVLAVLRRIDLHRTVPLALEIVANTNPGELVIAALELLAAAATCPPLADLAESLGIRSTPLRLAVARCLKHSKEPAEAQLLDLLADSDVEVATAAAESLATHGTTAAVMPLRERIKGFLVDGDLKRAAEGAVAAIQSNVGQGLGGSLSLLRERQAEGGLALPEDEREQG